VTTAAHRNRSELSAREREVAAQIASGDSNRQIASRLGVSERTVGAHVQNILNKLGFENRVQIATWWTETQLAVPRPAEGGSSVPLPASALPSVLRPNRLRLSSRSKALLAVCSVATLVALASDGVIPSAQSNDPSFLIGRPPVVTGQLIYQARLNGSEDEFTGPPWNIDDPGTSEVRFLKGSLEMAVLKPGGLSGIGPLIRMMPSYFGRVRLAVAAGSLVTFWFSLTQGDRYKGIGSYVVDINTYDETLQLVYFVDGQDVVPLSPQLPIRGLQAERPFWISALVQPPRFEIFLDDVSVVDLKHAPNIPLIAPSFQIFGDASGTVRITALEIYGLPTSN
jgi:DNA-binding CsgD family transcriptional regulator